MNWSDRRRYFDTVNGFSSQNKKNTIDFSTERCVREVDTFQTRSVNKAAEWV